LIRYPTKPHTHCRWGRQNENDGHQERRTRAGQVRFEEAALDNFIGKGGVVRAIVNKDPAKNGAEKSSGFG
jgi:hypothetical protein